MNGNDRFLNINDAHLRVTGGNVYASSFNLDQISITTTSTTASTINFLNETTAFTARSNIEVGTANLFVNTETSNVGIGTDAPEYTLDVHGTANVGALTATTFSGIGTSLTALNADNITSGTLNALRVPDLDAAKITGGTLPVSRGGTGTTSSTGSGALVLQNAPSFTGDATFDTDTLFVDSVNNKVGVGTTEPGATLEVTGNAYVSSNLEVGTANLFVDTVNSRVGVNTKNPEASLHLVGNAFVSSNLEVGTANLFVDTVNSRVGIGTASPSCTLDVRGSGQYAGIFSTRLWVEAPGDNSGDGSPDDNTGSPWYGLGYDNLAWNDQTHKYSGDIPMLSGFSGVALRSGSGNLVLTEAGNVGIGTTSPMNTGLHIAKQYTASGGNTDHFDPQLFITGNSGTAGTQLSAIGFSGASDADTHQRMVGGSIYYKGGGGSYGMAGYLGLAVADLSTSGADPYGLTEGELASHTRLAITNNGNVGIGTATPYAKLHVVGSSGRFSTSTEADPNTHHGIAHYFNYASGTIWRGNGDFGAVSIYGSDDIVSSSYIGSLNGFITASDSRIKKDITDVDDGSALETLRLLKPKKYKYKDVINRGDEPVWGFIAQEVGATLPYTTQLRTECIPNIYELANVSDSNVITFTNFDTSTLESNAMVLKVYDVNDTEHLVNIAEVIDGHSIRVGEDLGEWIGSLDETGNVIAGNQIFVYGQEVDDFVFLKKEAIFTVATAALQEVDRQLQAEKEKVTTLETQLASVLTRLDALENA